MPYQIVAGRTRSVARPFLACYGVFLVAVTVPGRDGLARPPASAPARLNAPAAAEAAPAIPSIESAIVAHDSLLARLVPTAIRAALLRASPELALRRAEVAAAAARWEASGFAPPVVLAGDVEDAPGAALDRATVRVDLERELLSGGRRRAAREVAVAELRAAEARLQAAEVEVVAAAFHAASRVAGWRAILERLAAQDTLLASAEHSLRTRFSVGQATYVDVLRLRTERLRVAGEQATAELSASTAQLELETMFASLDSLADAAGPARRDQWLDSLRLVAVSAELGDDGLPPPPEVEALLQASGVIAATDAVVADAVGRRQLLLAAQRPRLALGLGVQRFGVEAGAPNDFRLGPTLGVSLTLPFTSGRASRNSAIAADRAVESAEAARRFQLSARTRAAAVARARYGAARERLRTIAPALLRGAREERESALAAYQNGQLSLLALLDFERALAGAETARIFTYLEAIDALAALLGGTQTDSDEATTFAGAAPQEGDNE